MAIDLGELLKGVPKLDTGREQIEYIPLELLDADEKNFYGMSDIDGLADNIAMCGLQQPIRVRRQEDGRYAIVSGHRRRAALAVLVSDGDERWKEVPCIVQHEVFSPALQQLQLIFANSNTRKMTDAELSEQAVQVEKLLYQLKEEEGYEFPGRMRDHVAEVVGTSKSKLARLKVIRERLARAWTSKWKNGTLNESVAYELAQLPEEWQRVIYSVRSERYLDAKYVKIFRDRFEKIDKLKCKEMPGYDHCHNLDRKRQAAVEDPYCGKCCNSCPDLISCKYACPVMADKVAKLKADKREAKKQERAAQAEQDRPAVEKVSALWQRFGLAREMAGKTFDECKRALGTGYFAFDAEKVMKLECGEAKVSPDTKLPYNYNCYLSDVTKLITLADLFGCSIDYLLCRTDVKEMAQPGGAVSESDTAKTEPEFIPGAWYPASVEPPVGVELVLIDSDRFTDIGKYKGCGEYTLDYGDPVTLWTLMPQEKDVSAAPPAVTGWRSRTPETSGTYVAYLRLPHAKAPMLRELEWNGKEWRFFGTNVADDAAVQCWMERPDF